MGNGVRGTVLISHMDQNEDVPPTGFLTAEVARPVEHFPVRAAQGLTSCHAAVAR